MKKFLLILLMIVIGIVGLVLFERAVYLLSIIDRITQTVSLALLIISLPAVIVTAIYLIVKINEIIHPQ